MAQVAQIDLQAGPPVGQPPKRTLRAALVRFAPAVVAAGLTLNVAVLVAGSYYWFRIEAPQLHAQEAALANVQRVPVSKGVTASALTKEIAAAGKENTKLQTELPATESEVQVLGEVYAAAAASNVTVQGLTFVPTGGAAPATYTPPSGFTALWAQAAVQAPSAQALANFFSRMAAAKIPGIAIMSALPFQTPINLNVDVAFLASNVVNTP